MMRLGLGLRARANRLHHELVYWISNHIRRPNLYRLRSEERVGVIYAQPSDMSTPDKLMLYALVRGLRPERALEIGVRWGGSARIIANAMQDNNCGRVVGLDPLPEQFRATPSSLHGRYELMKGRSPEGLPAAVRRLGGTPDFVLIDAMHTYEAVLADFRGVMPYLSDEAHVVLHDSYHQGVNAAANEILQEYPTLVDCGFITRHPELGWPVSYQGLRLIRKGGVDGETLISAAYSRGGHKVPRFGRDLWNWDVCANRLRLGKLAGDH